MSGRKREFSKILWAIAMVNAAVVTVFAMVMMLITSDLTPLEMLIPSVFTELAAATGFYYSKAKAENRIKLRQKYGSEVYGESGAMED